MRPGTDRQLIKRSLTTAGVATFADGQLTDALKNIAADSTADKRVKKKLLLVLGSWRDQFKSDPSMSLIAGLYNQCSKSGRRLSHQELSHLVGLPVTELQKKDEERAKVKAKREKQEAKERARREREAQSQEVRNGGNRPKRAPFVFEKVHILLRKIRVSV